MDLFNTTAQAQAAPLEVLLRLLLAAALGGAVTWIHRTTRSQSEVTPSFQITLVLLAVLIAMVTQVVGNNVARAFSLVGALSIVRFRTVVRDTQDTAYVIFAVVVGMAVGAGHPLVAGVGLLVIGMVAFIMTNKALGGADARPGFVVKLRVSLGLDLEQLRAQLAPQVSHQQLLSVATARQGAALDVIYSIRLRPCLTPDSFIKSLNQIEGVQSAELRIEGEPED